MQLLCWALRYILRNSVHGYALYIKLPSEKFPADVRYRRGSLGQDIMAEQIPNCDIPERVLRHVSHVPR